jgi:hypothetical protein
MKEIADTIQARRSVQRHIIRSAGFQNADGRGRKLFVIDRRRSLSSGDLLLRACPAGVSQSV